MRKRVVVKASQSARRRQVVQASRSTGDMLNAFEAKLAEFGIESSTQIEATEYPAFLDGQVDVYGEDYHEKYEDVGGGFGEPGEIYSLADIKAYWNTEKDNDPVLEEYSSFDAWFRDTRANFLAEYYQD